MVGSGLSALPLQRRIGKGYVHAFNAGDTRNLVPKLVRSVHHQRPVAEPLRCERQRKEGRRRRGLRHAHLAGFVRHEAAILCPVDYPPVAPHGRAHVLVDDVAGLVRVCGSQDLVCELLGPSLPAAKVGKRCLVPLGRLRFKPPLPVRNTVLHPDLVAFLTFAGNAGDAVLFALLGNVLEAVPA